MLLFFIMVPSDYFFLERHRQRLVTSCLFILVMILFCCFAFLKKKLLSSRTELPFCITFISIWQTINAAQTPKTWAGKL